MIELPPGWTWATLEELVGEDGIFCDGDWVETKDQDPNGTTRLIQLADVGIGSFRDRSDRWINEAAFSRLGCTELQPDDVLIARMPEPLGRACLQPTLPYRSVTVVDVAVLRPGKGVVEPRWLMQILNAPPVREEIARHATGTTRKRISRKNLARIGLPLPPLTEQRRISDQLDRHLGRLTRGSQDLARCAYKLELLPMKFRRLAMQSISTEDTVPLLSVCELANGHTPAGLTASGVGSIPYYKVGDMNHSDGRYMGASRTYLTETEARGYKLKLRPAGTVVLPKRGGAIHTNKKRILARPGFYDLNTVGLVPSSNVRTQYLWHWLESIDLGKIADGSNVPQINRRQLEALHLPLPPLSRQDEIVSELDAAMDGIHRLLTEVGKARIRATPDALLAAAYRGELVGQDPADESADLMLARIRAQQRATAEVKSARKPRVRKAIVQ